MDLITPAVDPTHLVEIYLHSDFEVINLLKTEFIHHGPLHEQSLHQFQTSQCLDKNSKNAVHVVN